MSTTMTTASTFPMDYSSEPEHSPHLILRSKEPFNAEPSAAALVEFQITPEDLVFCRNHGPIREFDPETYSIAFHSIDGKCSKLTVNELKSLFPKHETVSVLQCAGIRRKEMDSIKPVNGVLWNDGVVANCRWAGARLSNVLRHLGLDRGDIANLQVCFASYATLCQDDNYYGSSIPLERALDAEFEVLLAYEMNGEDISPDHGAPIRVVIPGFLGARWVKWLNTVVISSTESPNFYQQRDYKLLPAEVETKDAAKSLWSKYPSMTALPLNSVIGSVHKSSPNTLFVKGYALPGATGNVSAVEVCLDDGQTWEKATITYQKGRWGWTLWETEMACNAEHGRVFCRATDTSGRVQPKEGQWNIRGLAYNGWGSAAF